MNKNELSKSVKIETIKRREHQAFPTSGCIVTSTPVKDLYVQFYIEYPTIKESTILELNAKEESSLAHFNIPTDGFTRELQTSVMLRPDVAYNIGQLLISKAIEAGVTVEPKQEKGAGKK